MKFFPNKPILYPCFSISEFSKIRKKIKFFKNLKKIKILQKKICFQMYQKNDKILPQ